MDRSSPEYRPRITRQHHRIHRYRLSVRIFKRGLHVRPICRSACVGCGPLGQSVPIRWHMAGRRRHAFHPSRPALASSFEPDVQVRTGSSLGRPQSHGWHRRKLFHRRTQRKRLYLSMVRHHPRGVEGRPDQLRGIKFLSTLQTHRRGQKRRSLPTFGIHGKTGLLRDISSLRKVAVTARPARRMERLQILQRQDLPRPLSGIRFGRHAHSR